MPIPFILAGASALGGMFSNFMSNQTNLSMVGQTNAANMQINREQMEHANQAATTAYNRQRQLYLDFQSPGAMMRQLQEAGLSPSLFYGMGGQGGSMASTQQATTPNQIGMQSGQVSPVLNAEMAAIIADAALKKAQKENTEADTEVKKSDLPLKDQMLNNLKQEVEESKQRIAMIGQEIQKKFAETMNEYQKHNNLKAEEELTKAKTDYEEAITKLTNIQISYEPQKIEAQIKEWNANAQQAIAAARKFNAEAETENQCRQFIVKNIQYAAEEQAYKTLHLQPAEYEKLKADIQSVILANDKEEGIREAYGSWKRYANHDRILDILNFAANAAKAVASNIIGGAAMKNAATMAIPK